MLCLSGFEQYSSCVPLSCGKHHRSFIIFWSKRDFCRLFIFFNKHILNCFWYVGKQLSKNDGSSLPFVDKF